MVYYTYEPYPCIRRREPSIFDGFTLSPLPYPILLILLLISIFLGIKFYPTYEEEVEIIETQVNWLLLATPIVLIFVVRWLSSFQNPDCYTAYGGRKCEVGGGQGGGYGGGGGSPWVVGALIVLVLGLVQIQSLIVDS